MGDHLVTVTSTVIGYTSDSAEEIKDAYNLEATIQRLNLCQLNPKHQNKYQLSKRNEKE